MSRVRLTRDERRNLLVVAAKELFGKNGYRKTEMVEIARKAGVTKPVLYSHFPNGKTEVFKAVLDEHVGKLLKALWEAMSSSEDPRERLHDGLRAYVQFADENPDGFRLLLESSGEPEAGIGGHIDEGRKLIVHGLSSTIADVMRAASIEPSGAPIYAFSLLGGVESVVQWWLTERSIDREAVIDHLLAFAWRGFDGLPRDPTRFHKERLTTA